MPWAQAAAAAAAAPTTSVVWYELGEASQRLLDAAVQHWVTRLAIGLGHVATFAPSALDTLTGGQARSVLLL